MIVVDLRNTSLVTNSSQPWSATVEHHIGLAVARRKASLGTMPPSGNIAEPQQKALEKRLGFQRDAADDEVAWDTSFHCMNLQHPAWPHLHSRPSFVESRQEKSQETGDAHSFHLGTDRS